MERGSGDTQGEGTYIEWGSRDTYGDETHTKRG